MGCADAARARQADAQLLQITGIIQQPDFAGRRKLICYNCPFHEGDNCTVVEEKYPGKANIQHGVVRGELECPKGKWGKEKATCRKCGRVKTDLVNLEGWCKWCVNKARIGVSRTKKSDPVPRVAAMERACLGCGRVAAEFNEGSEYCKLCTNKADNAKKNKELNKQRGNHFATSFRSIAGNQPRFIREEQGMRDAINLIKQIPPNVTAIVGIARSGLTPASRIAQHMHLPLFALRQTKGDIIDAGNGWRLGGHTHVKPPRTNVLVVDDTVMTGNSLRATKALLQREFESYFTCAVYVNPLAKMKPDFWAADLPWPHLLEWNLFNSILTPNLACDFDGIFCHDCPAGMDDDGPKYLEFIRNARPLYLPKRATIPLIVTARIEKYREETLKWLARHGIKVHRLVMHPAKTLRERQRDDIPAFKAREYAKWSTRHRMVGPPPSMFIESEDWQARRIYDACHKMVVCPHSGKVYGK